MEERQASSPGTATVSRFALATGLVTLATFAALSALTVRPSVPEWEKDVVRFTVDLPPWLMEVPQVLMHLSTRFTVPLLALAAYFVTRRWRAAMVVSAACVAGAVPVWIAKHAVSRPRPAASLEDVPARDDFYGSGYASGHITIAVAAAAAVAPYLLVMPRDRRSRGDQQQAHVADEILLPRETAWRWLLAMVPFVMAVGVGLARLYVGAHYPVDLVGGALAGVAGALLVLSLPHFRPETPSSIALLPAPVQQLYRRGHNLLGPRAP